FVALGRLPNEELPDGHMTIAPDLAVEAVSPNDLYYEVDGKIDEYFSAGVRLVWVLNPKARTAHVYHPDGSARRLLVDQDLDGEDVLPAFRCRVAALSPTRPAATDTN